MKILQTNNYGIFKTVVGNRNVSNTHIKYLKESLLNNNLLPVNPILVNEKMEVIDGQHRLEAAKLAGLPVFYIICEGAGLAEVQMLNSRQKGWSTNDYMNSYKQKGVSEYFILDDYCKKYNVPVSSALELMGDRKTRKGLEEYKAGNLTLSHFKEAEAIGNWLADYRKLLPKSITNNNKFIRALLFMHRKGVSHQKMMTKLNYQRNKVVKQGTTKDYLRVFEEIYNFKDRNSDGIRFF